MVGFRHQKRPRDFVRRQAAKKAQRQRRARFGREDWVACGEDQPQQVVADVIVQRCFDVGRRGVLLLLELVAELRVLPIEHLVAPEIVHGAIFRRRHEPRAGVSGDARRGPLFERSDERVVSEIFGEADVADDARERRDDFGRFDAPDRVDGALWYR